MFENELTPQQEQAVALALSGKKDGEIALAIGTSRQTVNTWRNHDDDFRAALAAGREALRDETADALQAMATEAMGVLKEAMRSENEYVRLRAAAIILKACEARTRIAKEKGVDREAIERQIVIASLTEALTDMGRVGKRR
jgi:transposase-like protein